MDNTFTLQPAEANGGMDLQENADIKQNKTDANCRTYLEEITMDVSEELVKSLDLMNMQENQNAVMETNQESDGYDALREFQRFMGETEKRNWNSKMTAAQKELEDRKKKEKRTAAMEEAMKIKRPYTLRPLKDKDLKTMLKIIKKMKLKEYAKTFFELITKEKEIYEVGGTVIVEIINLFVENIPFAYDDIYAFWSELSGIPVEKIEEMEFGTLPLMIFDTFSNAKGVSFFKVLSKLF